MQLPLRGRGTASNPPNRFETLAVEPDPEPPHDARRGTPTIYYRDASRSVISTNTSPDVPFDISLNPYRGCEHGCVYCYARPTHEYLGFSAGLDFETRIFVKEDAPELLERELSRRSWQPRLLALSGVTDPYQPIERRLKITRRCLGVLAASRHPVGLITKSALVLRDLDLIEELARARAVSVALSITTLDEELRRAMEPRASSVDLRFDAIARLRARGIPVGVSVAPVIPGLTDHEIGPILSRAADAGAQFAGYIMLRLPLGVADLFTDWLDHHVPDRKQKILHRIAELRNGALNDPSFGTRMKGTGVWSDTVKSLFRKARQRAGIGPGSPPLSTDGFRRPGTALPLFD